MAREESVVIRDDLLVQLREVEQKEGKGLAFLVDELIREGLERREENEAAKAECPF